MSKDKIKPDKSTQKPNHPEETKKVRMSLKELRMLNSNENEQKKLRTPEADALPNKQRKTNSPDIINDKTNYSALELYKFKTAKLPRLLDPFLQTVGLASLVGTSDSGKSTFLRQLAISIALGNKDFLGYKLNSKHNKVIFVSTEDDATSVSFSIRKQVDGIIATQSDIKIENLNNLDFIFDTTDLLSVLENKLKQNPVDLIVIDAFTDVFTKEINANTQVRNFLNQYDKLAKKYGCLILFLHHIGKRTQKNGPSKDNIIGSQAFEAKMRSVLELKPDGKHTALWVLKSNFLESKYKKNGQLLKLDNKTLLFENSNIVTKKISGTKSNNPEIIEKVVELKKSGYSFRAIESELKGTELQISNSTAQTIFTKQEEAKQSNILKELKLKSNKKKND